MNLFYYLQKAIEANNLVSLDDMTKEKISSI
jgi:hypothetical protein